MKIAAYICGDENIIYQSIVSLKSFKKYNDSFDYFLFSKISYFNQEQIEQCNKYSINFIDISIIEKLSKNIFSSGFKRWPKEVLLNYLVPYFFEDKYEYLLKLDYDTICIQPLEINKILPDDNQIISIILKSPITNNINNSDLKIIHDKYCKKKIELEKPPCTVNAGVQCIKVKNYNKTNFYDKFYEIYNFIVDNNIKIFNEFIEQWLLGFMQYIISHNYKKLPQEYNYRPAGINISHEECQKIKNEIKILHYSTNCKPWSLINIEEISKAELDNFSISWFRQLFFFHFWISECNEIGFKHFNFYNNQLDLVSLHSLFNEIRIRYKRSFNLHMIIINIAQKLPYFLIPNNNIGLYVQLLIKGITRKIHLEILYRKNNLLFCVHCEDEKLNNFVKDDFLRISGLLSVKPKDPFKIEKLINKTNAENEIIYNIYKISYVLLELMQKLSLKV